MPDEAQLHPTDSGARQPRAGLTMTWVPQRDAQGRTYLTARWAPTDAASIGTVSASRSAA
ncbi:hypothetical protein [Nocardioides sp.]|uniref:hypothetical protein n=1 Tax=Nocardioides sp. TaxID=35761 RepID=UPI0027350F21|nr:hypothetical protein [Nocardioides sp.]MDP3892529.1 hypothetical protein [Nocardioides sp.]